MKSSDDQANNSMKDNRLFFPATKRNQEAIEEIITPYLCKGGTVLELASGSGEHAVYFKQKFVNIYWQSSDINPVNIESINSWIKYYGLDLIMPSALKIDVEKSNWNISKELIASLKIIICINLLHVSSLRCTASLFRTSSYYLQKGSHLIIYGPFKKNGNHTSEGNILFDNELIRRNQNWGIKDLEKIIQIAELNSFEVSEIFEMPANNLTIIFKKYN